MMMLLALLLGLLLPTSCETFLVHQSLRNCGIKCHVRDPIPISHEFFQPGDLVLGMVASQTLFMDMSTDFSVLPYELPKKAM